MTASQFTHDQKALILKRGADCYPVADGEPLAVSLM